MTQPPNKDKAVERPIVLNAWGPGWEAIAFAQLEMSERTVRRMIARIDTFEEMKAGDPDLHHMSYTSEALFFSRELPTEGLEDEEVQAVRAMKDGVGGGEGSWNMLETALSEDRAIPTDMCEAIVVPGAIQWSGEIRHTEALAETGALTRGELRAILCHLVPESMFETEFGRLVQEAPREAVRMLETRTEQPVQTPMGQDPLLTLSRETVLPLLSLDDPELRERAIGALGAIGVTSE